MDALREWMQSDLRCHGWHMDALRNAARNDESLRKDKDTNKIPSKCSRNGPSSIKRAKKQQNLEFRSRKEQNRNASKINTTARTNKHNGEEMPKNSRKTHVVDQNLETTTTKKDPKKASGRQVSRLAKRTVR